ncbi:MAG: hypothetical protein ACJ761_01425 [Chloroflexota bacterium]
MRVRTAAVAVALSILMLGAAHLAVAVAPAQPSALDPAAFTLIATDAASVPAAPRAPAASPAVVEPVPAIVTDYAAELPSFGPRARPNQPVRASVVRIVPPKPKPKPTARTSSSGGSHRVRGAASWYCLAGVSACHHSYSGGMYAAAGSELRVGNWRGRSVSVCAASGCIRVKLIDWCACGGSRIIDLYTDAYRRLAPLSTGTQRVTVRW